MFRSLSTVLLTCALCVGLSACGDKDDSDTSDTASAGLDTANPGDTADTADTGGGELSCSPASSDFAGDGLPQAGVEWTDSGCNTTSGPPASDQLVLDEFSAEVFGGSGSTASVKSLSHGSFENNTGFYILSDLPPNTDVTVVLEEGATDVSVTFRITPGSPSVLSVSRVVFD